MQNVSSLIAGGVGYVMCGDDFCDLPMVDGRDLDAAPMWEYGNEALDYVLADRDVPGYTLRVANVTDAWTFSNLGCEIVADDGTVLGWIVRCERGYYGWANTEE